MNHIITVTGPSLTGKSTLESMLKEFDIAPVVSTTTRVMRTGEKDGVHYHFISKEAFEQKLKNEEFVEFVQVDGNFYGVGKKDVLDSLRLSGRAVIVCEPHGVKQVTEYVKANGWGITRVFLDNPMEVLIERFLERFKGDQNATPSRYASRLTNMLTTERQKWVEPALSGKDEYDLVLPSFDAKSQEQVIAKVLDKIDYKIAAPEGRKKKCSC